jgi:hypothetical protein
MEIANHQFANPITNRNRQSPIVNPITNRKSPITKQSEIKNH